MSEEGCKFTIEQIRKYILSKDSMGDILYYLNENNIKEANDPPVDDYGQIRCEDCNVLYCPDEQCACYGR